MAKDTYLKKVLGTERYNAIKESKVLMVGAGGIGCELLKDLLLSGFGEVHVVDLDTITLSNLNRQFLFRQKDIDKSKSLTVVKAVENFNYFGCKLVPHHGNVMDSSLFPIGWWNQFHYIYNALDNLEARRYVNSMALLLRKPLMESGTTGFEGQIQPIMPYKTECFECQPKATPKTYPVCTIRSTPSQPVHCIVWAKEFLFNQLFSSASEKEVTAADLSKETSDAKEIERILAEANELSVLKKHAGKKSFAEEVIKKIFVEDIEKALLLESLWKARKKPVPLDFEASFKPSLVELLRRADEELILEKETKVWSVVENLYVLSHSIGQLQQRMQSGESEIIFDKDDDDTMDFVAAAANLRSHVFHIELKSRFDIKQIAGNIIPAIATTNAIISGLSNLASLSFWSEKFSPNQVKSTFISIKENKRVTSALVEKPNPDCAACGIVSKGIASIPKDALAMSLGQFLDQVKAKYNYADDVSLILGKSKLIYDVDYDDNLTRSLSELAFHNNQLIHIEDDSEEYENLELSLVVGEGDELHLPDIELRAKRRKAEKEPEADVTMQDANGVTDETIVIEDEEPPSKKRRVEESFVEIL